MASSDDITSIHSFIEPAYLEIKPISLKNLHVADAERGVDMLGDLLKEEFKVSFLILGLKQDTITMLEEKVAYQATNMNTDYWRKERKLGIGSKAWTHGKGYRVEVQWLFGVLYVAVESEQARKVKDKLEGYGFDGSIVHVKILQEPPKNFIPEKWAKSASVA